MGHVGDEHGLELGMATVEVREPHLLPVEECREEGEHDPVEDDDENGLPVNKTIGRHVEVEHDVVLYPGDLVVKVGVRTVLRCFGTVDVKEELVRHEVHVGNVTGIHLV